MSSEKQPEKLVTSKLNQKGILLTNLGTPDAPTAKALRPYLKQFLSDRRVIEIPKVIWWFILHLFILTFRARNSARLYQRIWTDKGSPLLAITLKQAKKLQQILDQYKDVTPAIVKVGMRYGQPSIDRALKEFEAEGIHQITVLPLYPQYSATTTGSTFDAVTQALQKQRWVPSLKFINGYHLNNYYLNALENSIHEYIAEHGKPEQLLLSFHGIPERTIALGDPYYSFCQQTSEALQKKLLAENLTITMCFQSRFGKAVWLQPYTDKMLKELAEEGIKDIAICCPGFSTDCLETLEEIQVENKQVFLNAGGENYHYIPCLNDSRPHIEMMANILTGDNK